MKKAIVIDGNSLVYRAFYATLSQAEFSIEHNLQPVNALKLMLNFAYKLKNDNYDYCLIAFDHQKKNFRHKLLNDYKAGRKPMPEALVSQLELIKENLNHLGFNILSINSKEADDLIGSFCEIMKKENIQTSVFSSDKDMLQLVDKNVEVHLIKKGLTQIQINNSDNFEELNNMKPSQVTDFKGIVGDASDNLIGVKGIGEKTGLKLINEYGSLENIYNHLTDLSSSNQNKFNDSKEMAFLCKELATIETDIFLEYSSNDFKFKESNKKLLKETIEKYNISGLDKIFE